MKSKILEIETAEIEECLYQVLGDPWRTVHCLVEKRKKKFHEMVPYLRSIIISLTLLTA